MAQGARSFLAGMSCLKYLCVETPASRPSVAKLAARLEETHSGPNVGENNFYCHEILENDTEFRDM
jgi:hypothetical protein